mmetsp:Transcript_64647/g.76541  ORF Transcript_64647/g.76541 Transcript_64647/m.76541 type:complete len:119 (-) Transcript_64647:205-561(-)
MALHASFSEYKNNFSNDNDTDNDGCVAIYTTPLKALSNQKFSDLRNLFSKKNVGLLTGDISINRSAKILVMTTEVYRNLCWNEGYSNTSNSFLFTVRNVILDEFHYMGQPDRGGVWEE